MTAFSLYIEMYIEAVSGSSVLQIGCTIAVIKTGEPMVTIAA